MLARTPSAVLVLAAIGSVQFGAAFAATLFHRIGPGGAGLLRLLTASIILLAVWRPRVRHRSRRDLALVAAFGVALAGMNLVFYHALDRIPLGIAVTIEFAGPLAVAVAGSRRAVDLLWVAMAVAGILALTHGSHGHAIDPLGVAFALIAGGFWALYILLGVRLGRAFEAGTGLALAMPIAAVLALPDGLAEGGSHLVGGHVLLIGAAVGLLSSAIPYSLELEALRRMPAHVFGVLMSLEPAMAALAGLVVLGQGLSARAVAGIVLVVLASVGAATGARRRPVAAVEGS